MWEQKRVLDKGGIFFLFSNEYECGKRAADDRLIMRNIGAYIEGRCVVNLCWMVCWQHDNGVKSILVCKETNIFSCFMIYNKSVQKKPNKSILLFFYFPIKRYKIKKNNYCMYIIKVLLLCKGMLHVFQVKWYTKVLFNRLLKNSSEILFHCSKTDIHVSSRSQYLVKRSIRQSLKWDRDIQQFHNNTKLLNVIWFENMI